jgi:hypothetical protein
MIEKLAIGGLLAAAMLAATPGLAQPVESGPLAPGRPAGVRQAEINEVPFLIVTGVVTMVLGILVLYPHSSSTAPAAVVVSSGTG